MKILNEMFNDIKDDPHAMERRMVKIQVVVAFLALTLGMVALLTM